MTEIDTSRVERPCPNCGVTLNGWSGLRHSGYYTTHAHADCIENLRRRAEKAERQRDYNSEVIEQRNVMLTRAEAERDTAWNDAIEAAAKAYAEHQCVQLERWEDVPTSLRHSIFRAIRALRK